MHTQSFVEASRQLRVERSVATTRIKQLGDYHGALLFHRSTRVVRLSETGQAFLRDCIDLVGRANDIVDQMRDVRSAPSGTLRLHALPGFVLGHSAQVLRDFQENYPDINLDFSVSDAMIDPEKEGRIAPCKYSHRPPKNLSPLAEVRDINAKTI